LIFPHLDLAVFRTWCVSESHSMARTYWLDTVNRFAPNVKKTPAGDLKKQPLLSPCQRRVINCYLLIFFPYPFVFFDDTPDLPIRFFFF